MERNRKRISMKTGIAICIIKKYFLDISCLEHNDYSPHNCVYYHYIAPVVVAITYDVQHRDLTTQIYNIKFQKLCRNLHQFTCSYIYIHIWLFYDAPGPHQ